MAIVRRKTAQRDVVLHVLTIAGRPLSPQEIFDIAKDQVPSLGIATVYRNIKTLTENGTLKPVELPGTVQRYELAGKHHHHHFHCNTCGKVYEIEGCSMQHDDHPNVPEDFEVDDHVVVLYGRCADCTQHEAVKENTAPSQPANAPSQLAGMVSQP
ncbi:transcriptional repressor [bacterium]|nr:transcriptional repressor [bacterium]